MNVNFTFQFTPLREGRLDERLKVLDYLIFQFTPLREGRRKGRCHPGEGESVISIHAPA